MYALEDINPGDELFVNFDKQYWRDFLKDETRYHPNVIASIKNYLE
jgi:hypothetical protein